jgi:hypothetical protein
MQWPGAWRALAVLAACLAVAAETAIAGPSPHPSPQGEGASAGRGSANLEQQSRELRDLRGRIEKLQSDLAAAEK